MDAQYERLIRERRKKWAAELVSGYYRQASGALKSDDSRYCCLGVACEVFAEELSITSAIPYGFSRYVFTTGGRESATTLPEPLRKYLGITLNGQNILMHLNDSGVSFKTIAGMLIFLEIEEPQE